MGVENTSALEVPQLLKDKRSGTRSGGGGRLYSISPGFKESFPPDGSIQFISRRERFWPGTLLRNKDPLGRSILPVASLGDGGEEEGCRGVKKHKSLYLWSGEGVSQQALTQRPNTGASAITVGWFSTPPTLIPSRTLHKVTATLKTQPVSNPPFKHPSFLLPQ